MKNKAFLENVEDRIHPDLFRSKNPVLGAGSEKMALPVFCLARSDGVVE